MQRKNRVIFLLGIFFLVTILCQNVLAQNPIKKSIVYLKDKVVLKGNLTRLNDSTVQLYTANNEEIIIKDRYIDSVKQSNTPLRNTTSENDGKVKVGFIFSIQPMISKYINTNKYSYATPPDFLKSFCLGPGINIGNCCLSILPSFEDLGNPKTNFLFYPDLKIFFDDIYKPATGYIEFNYFSNSFVGNSTSGSVINCNIGALLGDPKFKIALHGGIKFINNYIYFNFGTGVHFMPNNSVR